MYLDPFTVNDMAADGEMAEGEGSKRSMDSMNFNISEYWPMCPAKSARL